MTQPNANKWLHILLIVLHQTLRDLGDAPARHLLALRERLAQLQTEDDADTAPLFITMAPNDQSLARTGQLHLDSCTFLICFRDSRTTLGCYVIYPKGHLDEPTRINAR
jgi:hypothetical protein